MRSALSIPLDRAFELCKAYRERRGVRLFSQCRGCVRYSKEVPEKMCFFKSPTHDGCKFVNGLFESSMQ